MGLSRSSWGEMEVAAKPPGGELRKESGILEAKSGKCFRKEKEAKICQDLGEETLLLSEPQESRAALAIK